MDEHTIRWLMRDEYADVDMSDDVPSWHADAACRDVPTSVFFPERGDDHRPAVEVCSGCPVAQDCLRWAVDNGERYGVWGGLTSRQRAELARQAAA